MDYGPTKTEEQPNPPSSIKQTMLLVAKGLYFAHLFGCGLLAGALLIKEPQLLSTFTFTLVLVLVYGFILVWLLLFNLFAVCVKKEKWAVWCNRFFAKLVIMAFPIPCLVTYSHEHFLNMPWVAVFMIYQLAVSILLMVYQFYACTWGHHEEPSFLYHPNDLVDHTNQVWNRRKEFLKNRGIASACPK